MRASLAALFALVGGLQRAAAQHSTSSAGTERHTTPLISGTAPHEQVGQSASKANNDVSQHLQDDVATVRQRVLDLLTWPAPDDVVNNTAAAIAYVDKLLPNCTFRDVNYNDPGDRTIWATSSHLSRVSAMAAAYSQPSSTAYLNASLFNATRCAANLWLQQDYQNVNWWYNLIFTPQSVSSTFLMLDTAGAPPTQPPFPNTFELSKGLELMFRAAWWNASLGYEVTGANLAWMLQAQVARGLMPSALNVSALDQGFVRLWQEIYIQNDTAVFGGQGIQTDWSFHMHGPQLQIGSYGQDYASEMLLFSDVTRNTTWNLPPDKLQLLCAYLAEGAAWLSTGRSYEMTGVGRQLSRNTWSAEYECNLNTTRIRQVSAGCSAPYDTQIAAWADAVDLLPTAQQVVGNKHYFNSDHMVHRREGWTSSVHMHSIRTDIAECGNGEDLLGEYLSQGLLTLWSANMTACSLGEAASVPGCGLEYAGVFPLLDWHLLDGTTAESARPIPDCPNVCCWTAEVASFARSFVGGASDGTYGVTAYDYVSHGITAHKSWFFFDNAILQLWTNMTISDSPSPIPVSTALTSRFWRNPSFTLGFANGTVNTLSDGNYSLPASDGAQWVAADGNGWIVLPAAVTGGTSGLPEMHISAEYRQAPWSIIGPYPGTAQGRVFSAWIQHAAAQKGMNRSWTEAGGYLTIPAVDPAAMPAIAANTAGLAGILNEPLVQGAVDPAAAVALVTFWPNGTSLDGYSQNYSYAGPTWNVTLRSSAPALLVYRETTTAAILAISNPDTPGITVSVDILNRAFQPTADCQPRSQGGMRVTVKLPADANHQGQSIVVTCPF